jgi:hypothetical protein
MARFTGTVKSKSANLGSKSVPSIGAPSNVNHDKSLVLHAPRLKAIQTRNYGKGAPVPSAYPNQTQYGGGVGFGSTGQPDGGY